MPTAGFMAAVTVESMRFGRRRWRHRFHEEWRLLQVTKVPRLQLQVICIENLKSLGDGMSRLAGDVRLNRDMYVN